MRKKAGDRSMHPAAAGMAALDIAIENAGGPGALASLLGISPPSLRQWRTVRYAVPLEYIPAIVAIANDIRVTPFSLRPDFAAQWSVLAQQLVYGEVVRYVTRETTDDTDEVAA